MAEAERTEAPWKANLVKAQAERQRLRSEGMAAAREWRDRHRRLGTVWGIPPQPPQPICSGCGRPIN